MITHALKCYDRYFHRIIAGEKTCEIRKNDRDFQVGDFIILQAVDDEGRYLSHCNRSDCTLRITHVLHGGVFGLEAGYCALSFQLEAR